ncbi:MAG: dTDP-glucose 4,6-dehydratase [Desulfobacterota bacterium]|nr:dTDP-glucose 4,6-dehydratase [Thermodesulfobacteriota bacterium]
MNLLITGGCGFIGSNFVRHVLKRTEHVQVINLDLLTYAGNLANLTDVQKDFPRRYRFIKGDVSDKEIVRKVFDASSIDGVVHFAAESHVDRSILGPEAFVRTNVYGTFNLLEACRQFWLSAGPGVSQGKRFIHVSTDEVYGSLGSTGHFTEETPYDPSSPYSASKAASDHLARAYFRTYGLPTLITNCSNNYGPYQFPEKLIPLMIHNAMKGLELPVYGDGGNVRDWLHVEDHCSALRLVLEKGRIGEAYNIGSGQEYRNIDTARMILAAMHAPATGIEFVKDRPGHDIRYSLSAAKITRELGWKAKTRFPEGLRTTIDWYLTH